MNWDLLIYSPFLSTWCTRWHLFQVLCIPFSVLNSRGIIPPCDSCYPWIWPQPILEYRHPWSYPHYSVVIMSMCLMLTAQAEYQWNDLELISYLVVLRACGKRVVRASKCGLYFVSQSKHRCHRSITLYRCTLCRPPYKWPYRQLQSTPVSVASSSWSK